MIVKDTFFWFSDHLSPPIKSKGILTTNKLREDHLICTEKIEIHLTLAADTAA